ncbi:glycoside hydrolase family 3 protein [Rathayibacter festucae]|uniref:glycoside hydrolase family 3 protein n=1 Tax=Rathayibacter festucae TaxID=110937 RepID=UPI002A6A5830|nr:glycoside hydrolase family 3 N-terminal domain-containing protein [Rathayibacter festucae]MDY0914538.1 glycoside hydrolase family 3 N-terminal domain-containing protein [Rathayibacter festucae]
MTPGRAGRGGRATLAASTIVALALTGGALTAQSAQPATAAPLSQPSVQSRVKPVLTVDGLQFRDLDGSGAVEPYEDWRLGVEQRADDLVARMTLAEKAGLMLINTMNAGCDAAGTRGAVPDSGRALLDEQNMRRFVFRSVVADPAVASCSSPSPSDAATFTNAVQEISEASRLGIPSLFKSNARNHIDPDVRFGINEAAGVMTAFPKEPGLAAAALGEARVSGVSSTGDMSVIEDFAGVMGEEWSAIGLRGMYGYMADLSTEPRWYRTHETFTEDSGLNSEIMASLVQELQGEVDENGVSLSPETDVALTLKHFPGGGPQELGFDPHYSFGKTQVYPGNAFGDHVGPFAAAIDAGVSSIMPYYGAPIDLEYKGVQYNPTGMAFSDQIVNDLLRDDLGFKGYVNSDTGIITDRAWGLEDATVPERVAAAVNGGTDTLSGFSDTKTITDLVDQGLLSEERVDLAAHRLLTPLFQMGLFENPYVDAAAADSIVGSARNEEIALDLQRKSLVLLQNEETPDGGAVLPLAEGSKIYVLGDVDPAVVAEYGYEVVDGNTVDENGQRPSAAGSDYVVVSMRANNVNTGAYDSRVAAETAPINPIVAEGFEGLDGESRYGATDACVAQGAPSCTDNGLRFGGSLPWESSILDFSGMSEAESWQVTPSLDVVQQAMQEVGDPDKVVLNVYFRQPFVLDEASGLRDAGAIVAGFGSNPVALMDVLSGDVAPQGRMPFALAGTRDAVEQQYSDLAGYAETEDGALFEFGHGLTYEQKTTLDVNLSATSRVSGGKTTVTVTATNNEDVAAGLSVVTPYGSIKLPALKAGATITKGIAFPGTSLPSGTVAVKVTATVDGREISLTEDVTVTRAR